MIRMQMKVVEKTRSCAMRGRTRSQGPASRLLKLETLLGFGATYEAIHTRGDPGDEIRKVTGVARAGECGLWVR